MPENYRLLAPTIEARWTLTRRCWSSLKKRSRASIDPGCQGVAAGGETPIFSPWARPGQAVALLKVDDYETVVFLYLAGMDCKAI
jgi:hypothetical protein